jgi:penicillin-binding protein 1A
MQQALGIAPPPPPPPAAEPDDGNTTDGNLTIDPGIGPVPVEGSIEGLGMNVQVKKDGTIRIAPAPDTGDRPPRPPDQ